VNEEGRSVRKSEKARVTRISSVAANELAILTAARSRPEVKHAEHVKATVRCIALARRVNARRVRRIHPRPPRFAPCRRYAGSRLNPAEVEEPSPFGLARFRRSGGRKRAKSGTGRRFHLHLRRVPYCQRGAPQLHATGLRRRTRLLYAPASASQPRRASGRGERDPLLPPPFCAHRFTPTFPD